MQEHQFENHSAATRGIDIRVATMGSIQEESTHMIDLDKGLSKVSLACMYRPHFRLYWVISKTMVMLVWLRVYGV